MAENYIYLYGAGSRCYTLYELIKDKYDKIIIIDSNPAKWGSAFNAEISICSPDVLKKTNNKLVVITVLNARNYDDILNDLYIKYNIKDTQILSYEKLCWDNLKEAVKDKEETSVKFDKNISIIFDAYCCQSLGGIEEWIINLAAGLVNRKCKVRILTDDERSVVNDSNKDYSDIVHRVGTYESSEYLENYKAVKMYIKGKMPCIIITNRCNVVTMAACDLKEKYGNAIKVISVMHNGNKSYYERQCVYHNYVDKYVGVAYEMIEEMKNRGIDSEKLCATTLPFECETHLKRDYTLQSRKPIQIGYAGRLDRIKKGQKRMDLLLDIIYKLADEKINFHLTFAGEGLAKYAMEESINKRRLQPYVTFLGKIDRKEIPKFWKKMDVGINMADYEGRCISKLEMMANGAVPIFTDVTGATEDIINNVNGYIIPVGDVRAAVNRIKYLQENRNILVTMGKRAHESMLGKGDWNHHYDFWMKLIDEIDSDRVG